jgi:hypothetical protein
LDILFEEYRDAIQRLNKKSIEDKGLMRPEEHLIEHLMAYYWHGKIDLTSKDKFIEQLFSKTSDSLRAHALTFLGHNLNRYEGTIPVEVLDRLRELWSWKKNVAQKAESASDYTMELGSFGWWFASKRFDDDWALTQLKDALIIGAQIEPDHRVLEHMVTISNSRPYITIECLRLIIGSDKEGWNIHGWREQAKEIIQNALQSTDVATREAATTLIHYLRAKGLLHYRDLLSAS